MLVTTNVAPDDIAHITGVFCQWVFEVFAYPKEVPPDLFIFQSWHPRRAYKFSFLADDLWKQLLGLVSDAQELKQYMAADNRHVSFHDHVRRVMGWPAYLAHSPWIGPTPEYVSRVLANFLEFYSKSRPWVFGDEKPPVEDKPSEPVLTEAEQADAAEIEQMLVKNDVQDRAASPPAPKAADAVSEKRGPGRPKKK